jgi:hypothetical protein
MTILNRNLVAGFALCAGLAAAPAHGAVNLTFTNPASVTVGSLFDVDLIITGLATADLASFDVDVTFDDAVVGFQGYTLGSELTDPILGQFDFSLGETGPGEVNLAEASAVLPPPDDFGFFSAQPDLFVLATMTFEALATGTADFGIGETYLFDPFDVELDAVVPGQVQVVPLPGAAFLFAGALAALGLLRRRGLS